MNALEEMTILAWVSVSVNNDAHTAMDRGAERYGLAFGVVVAAVIDSGIRLALGG